VAPTPEQVTALATKPLAELSKADQSRLRAVVAAKLEGLWFTAIAVRLGLWPDSPAGLRGDNLKRWVYRRRAAWLEACAEGSEEITPEVYAEAVGNLRREARKSSDPKARVQANAALLVDHRKAEELALKAEGTLVRVVQEQVSTAADAEREALLAAVAEVCGDEAMREVAANASARLS
jgi:hypothetical protein